MTIWIVTIGSSDVQLLPQNSWQKLFRTARSKIPGSLQFEPRQLEPDPRKPSLVPSRVMGMVYGEQPIDELVFPLLDNFRSLIEKEILLGEGDRIVVLLTDQSQVFELTRYAQDKTSAYWQDTCALEPILECYFKQHYPKVETSYVLLKPEKGNPGLDDWNDVLGLVQKELGAIAADAEETVYVSHQAGTPAISSAVQFASLAQFGDRVKFLVSNEFDTSRTKTIESSSYLVALRLQEARILLSNYNYLAVKELIGKTINPQDMMLLEAGIQFNYANLDQFSTKLQGHDKFNKLVKEWINPDYWWLSAYESAYLAWMRLKQGNTVEAMFHSFRAVEGLLKTWADKCYPDEIKSTKHPLYDPKKPENDRHDRNLNSYGQDLYWFLTTRKTVDQIADHKQNKTLDIFIFGSQVFNKRNNLFHQLKGLMGREEVFENWRSKNEKQWGEQSEKKWKMRVLNCLNFISDQNFKSLEEASLMAQVHGELVEAIERIQVK